jgi:hypothetical protein
MLRGILTALLSCFTAFGFFLFGPVSSASATLTFSRQDVDAKNAAIFVSGVFEPRQDLSSFTRLARGLGDRRGIVVFDSPGGNPSKAIELGRLIRSLGLSTFQMRSVECASACALAFMGGVSRTADAGSIGLHKSSFGDNSDLSVDDAVSSIQEQTAETIGYLIEMGVDPSLLQLSLRYERDDMRYLSKNEMQEYRVTNIDVDADVALNIPDQPSVEPSKAPPQNPTPALPDRRVAQDEVRFEMPVATSGVLRSRWGNGPLLSEARPNSTELAELRNGQPVEILGVEGWWYKVRTPENTGFLHHSWVKVDQFLNQPFDNTYIQIARFDDYGEAEAYIRNSKLPLSAYLAADKSYVVAFSETLSPTLAADLLKQWKADKSVPEDAALTFGNTYAKVVCCHE